MRSLRARSCGHSLVFTSRSLLAVKACPWLRSRTHCRHALAARLLLLNCLHGGVYDSDRKGVCGKRSYFDDDPANLPASLTCCGLNIILFLRHPVACKQLKRKRIVGWYPYS